MQQKYIINDVLCDGITHLTTNSPIIPNIIIKSLFIPRILNIQQRSFCLRWRAQKANPKRIQISNRPHFESSLLIFKIFFKLSYSENRPSRGFTNRHATGGSSICNVYFFTLQFSSLKESQKTASSRTEQTHKTDDVALRTLCHFSI